MKPNIVDRVVGFFSPAAERKRLQERARIAAMGGRREYQGATAGRRQGDWIRSSNDGTTEANAAAKSLREGARDLVRNNAYASLGLHEWETNATPVAARAQVDTQEPVAARAFNQKIDTLWYEWCQRADFYGTTNFDGLQGLVVRAVVQDGGCLVRRRRVPSTVSPLGFQLQLLEMDFLDSGREHLTQDNGNTTIGGIEYDADGRKVAYWLYRQHPGSRLRRGTALLESVRVPADEVLHVFEPLRAGQQVGASWLAPVMLRSRDIDGYEEAELVRKQTEACLAAFVEDANPSDGDPATIGQSATDAEGNVIETFSPGMMTYLPPGRTVKFNQPSSSGGYPDYIRTQLRGFAAGLGLTYELLTGDLSQVNFSSARMGLLAFKRRVRKLQNKVLIPQLLDPVWGWFIEAAVVVGQVPEGRRVWAKWTPPRWESIQPVDDANADLIDIRSGARTLAQVITERGGDPADQLAEIAETNAMLDDLGIVLDSDPRQRTKTGNPAEQPTAAAPAQADAPPVEPARILRLAEKETA